MVNRSGAFMKRALDIWVSAAGLVVLALPLMVIGILIKLESPGPVFFRQERIGKDGKPFRIWKFRTMVDGATDFGMGSTTGKEDPRITRVGQLLREMSLDEVPQLISVLKGDMSLIGPRPTLGYQVELYTEEQRHRLDVKPGVSSWAAVRGRNTLSWEERITLDVWYVRNRSFLLDLFIIARSVWVAFVTREGIYGADGVNDDFSRIPAQETRGKAQS